LVNVYTDEGLSGRKTSNRPALEAAITRVSEVKGSLIVYSLSRLARSTVDAISIAGRLQRAGAQLVMLAEQVDTNSAAGRMFYTVLAALAAFESDQIGERTKLALSHKRNLGERYCKDAPYGFQFAEDGRLVQSDNEQAVLRRMRELRDTGLSLREIAVWLHEEGVKSRGSGPLSFAQIGRLLRRGHASANL
jgi:site-specific DNA recombinase